MRRVRTAASRFLLRVGVFGLILAACMVAACGDPAEREPFVAPRIPYPDGTSVLPEDGYLYEAERLAPRVYAIQSPEPFHYQPLGNVTLVEQSDGLVLIDAGGTAAAAERVIALVRAIAPTLPVKAIVLTHWHGDHAVGLRRLLEEWPQARAISTDATLASLKDEATLDYLPTSDRAATDAMLAEMHRVGDYFASRGADTTLAAEVRDGFTRASRVMHQHATDLGHPGSIRAVPTETFTDSLALADRHAPIHVRFLGRANTDGDAVAWLPRQRILVTGDIVVAPMPYGFYSYPADWLEVLERTRAFDFDVLVPGHGQPMRDITYLNMLSSLIQDVRAQVGEHVAAGATLDETRERVDFSAPRDAFSGGDEWRKLIFDFYWVEPIVQSAWLEARGEPILQGRSP